MFFMGHFQDSFNLDRQERVCFIASIDSLPLPVISFFNMIVDRIRRYLSLMGWIDGVEDICFLAAGEYNKNFLVKTANRSYVFRINHGSQLELDNQAEYEYKVLCSVAPSGVTPRPYRFSIGPEVGECDLGNGVLLMDFLPGGAFEYRRDWKKAAIVFAAVHTLPVKTQTTNGGVAGKLIHQVDPVFDIAAESLSLLHRYPDHPLRDQQKRLLEYHGRVLGLADETRDQFTEDRLCIVNTEVNSGNFIVDKDLCFLVDWEKAVVSYRYQDLGHFLVPTTTLWKTSFTFSEAQRMDFLREYALRSDIKLPLPELSQLTRILEQTILLRALSWSYMAYYEYVQNERKLKNNDTFSTIKSYMDQIEWFLR
jgi:hypothetical protein